MAFDDTGTDPPVALVLPNDNFFAISWLSSSIEAELEAEGGGAFEDDAISWGVDEVDGPAVAER